MPNRSTELLGQSRQVRPVMVPEFSANWHSGPCQALETLGVLDGAGWYEIELPVSAAASVPPVLHLPHMSDIASVYTDEGFAGSFLGDGGPLDIPLPEADQSLNSRRLRIRTEIWGHSNFHDTRWPAAHLGSLRGIQDIPQMHPAVPAERWRFAPESSAETGKAEYIPAGPGAAAVAGGETCELRFSDLPVTGKRGAVLTLAGMDCMGEIWTGRRFVGRFLFGPELPVKLTGGPSDRFFLSSSWVNDSADLRLIVRGIGRGECRLTSATLELLG